MEKDGKAPNTGTAFKVTQIPHFTSLCEPPLFSSHSLFRPKTFSGWGNFAVDKLNNRKFPEVSLNTKTEAFRKQASRLKEGGMRKGQLRTINNWSLNIKYKCIFMYIHTPARNIPWHFKIRSPPLTSPHSLARHTWYGPSSSTACLQ